MILKFLKKWSYYIVSSFIVLLIVFIFLYPHLFMGDETIERTERIASIPYVFSQKREIEEKLITGEPISLFEETPDPVFRINYFYRSTDGAMYIQTDKRAYFLIPTKKDGAIEWTCYSSDSTIPPYGGCTFIDLNSQNT